MFEVATRKICRPGGERGVPGSDQRARVEKRRSAAGPAPEHRRRRRNRAKRTSRASCRSSRTAPVRSGRPCPRCGGCTSGISRHRSLPRHPPRLQSGRPGSIVPRRGACGGQSAGGHRLHLDQERPRTSFTTTGQVQLSNDAEDKASSAGSLRGRYAANAPAPGAGRRLIGRIGNGQPFAIGNQTAYLPMPGQGHSSSL